MLLTKSHIWHILLPESLTTLIIKHKTDKAVNITTFTYNGQYDYEFFLWDKIRAYLKFKKVFKLKKLLNLRFPLATPQHTSYFGTS